MYSNSLITIELNPFINAIVPDFSTKYFSEEYIVILEQNNSTIEDGLCSFYEIHLLASLYQFKLRHLCPIA